MFPFLIAVRNLDIHKPVYKDHTCQVVLYSTLAIIPVRPPYK